MRAMVLPAQASIDGSPLRLEDVPRPEPGPGEILVQIEACGVCRTDLHVVEGDLPPEKMPIIPGHQVVGRVVERGPGASRESEPGNRRLEPGSRGLEPASRGLEPASRFAIGDRAGIAWLRSTDGTCRDCRRGQENLCPNARFTGYMADGGYAEYAVVREDFAYTIPPDVGPFHAAPLLCAGIIGYRALKRTEIQPLDRHAGPRPRLGIYGFGASAHVAIQVALHWGCEVFVATRGERHQTLAREMGAAWVGGAGETPPEKLDGAILFAPAGELVPSALAALDRGGTLAVAGIYLSDIPPLQYERHLFYERTLRSVTANTREDGAELLQLAAEIPIHTHTEIFPLEEANEALQKLKHDGIQGAAVLSTSRSAPKNIPADSSQVGRV
jgi:propanol-preferring alcohol dehydrogenase